MHAKYLTLLCVCLATNGIVIPNDDKDGMSFCSTCYAVLKQIQDSDGYRKLVDGVNTTDNNFHHAVNSTKHKIEDHRHKDVKTLETVKSKGGATMTVVTVPDGPAVTLAGPGHGKATTFEGHMYTILPVTFIDPASSHFSSITEPSSFRKTATAHGHLTSSHKAASSTHTPSAMTSSHVVKTTITSGKNKATVVSVSGGPAVTLAAKGTTTVIGGSTYTVQPQASSGSSSASANASKASESDSSIAANASTSASTSSTPNAAVTRITGSFYTIVVGSTVTLVGVLFGAFLIL